MAMDVPTDLESMETRLASLFQAAEDDAVQRFGLKRGYVSEKLAPFRDQVFLSASGSLRIMAPDEAGRLLPPTQDDVQAAGLLAGEIGKAAPEEAVMDLAEQHEEQMAREQADRAQLDPRYRL